MPFRRLIFPVIVSLAFSAMSLVLIEQNQTIHDQRLLIVLLSKDSSQLWMQKLSVTRTAGK